MKLPINAIAVLFLVASGAGLGTQWLFDRDSHMTPDLPAAVTDLLTKQGFVLTGRRPLSGETPADASAVGYFFETPDCRPPLIVVPVASPDQASVVQWTYAAAHDKRVFFIYEGAITDTFPETAFIIGEAWRAGASLWHGESAALMPVLTIVRDRGCGQHAAVDWHQLDQPHASGQPSTL